MASALRPPLANTSAPRDGEPDPGDVEKLRKWQEDRIARKLRGEYESAVLHLSDVVSACVEWLRPQSINSQYRSTTTCTLL
jgi:outer membrane protein insertion porin family